MTEVTRSPLISVLAHIQDHGDIYFPEGQAIKHPTEANKRIEGIMVTSALPDDIQLQYMGHVQGTPTEVGGDTPWIDARAFMGTTGQSRALEGVAFRLRSKSNSPIPYTVHYQVQIAGSDWTKVCSDEEYCGTRVESKAITGLRVWLTEKTVAHSPTGENEDPMDVSISGRNSPKTDDERENIRTSTASPSTATSAR